MQSNTIIDEAFTGLFAEIDAIIQLTKNGTGGRRSTMINRESLLARTSLIKARSRYKDFSAQKPHTVVPTSSSLAAKQSFQPDRGWAFCSYCDEIISTEKAGRKQPELILITLYFRFM